MLQDLLDSYDKPNAVGSSQSEQIQTITDRSNQVDIQSQDQVYIGDSSKRAPIVFETGSTQIESIISETEIVLESESFAMHDLAYACVLVPRLSEHRLEGVISSLLNVEVARLCLAFGWRLENLMVASRFLQWVVSVSPHVPAADVILNIRDKTSALIFKEFPRLSSENPSGDFWAPGFLVVHGRMQIPGSLIDDYIKQTRRKQGIN